MSDADKALPGQPKTQRLVALELREQKDGKTGKQIGMMLGAAHNTVSKWLTKESLVPEDKALPGRPKPMRNTKSQ